jgi:hypothetical protein
VFVIRLPAEAPIYRGEGGLIVNRRCESGCERANCKKLSQSFAVFVSASELRWEVICKIVTVLPLLSRDLEYVCKTVGLNN